MLPFYILIHRSTSAYKRKCDFCYLHKLCNKNENLRPTQSSLKHSTVQSAYTYEQGVYIQETVIRIHQMDIFVSLFQSYFNARLFCGACIKISFIIVHREEGYALYVSNTRLLVCQLRKVYHPTTISFVYKATTSHFQLIVPRHCLERDAIRVGGPYQ